MRQATNFKPAMFPLARANTQLKPFRSLRSRCTLLIRCLPPVKPAGTPFAKCTGHNWALGQQPGPQWRIEDSRTGTDCDTDTAHAPSSCRGTSRVPLHRRRQLVSSIYTLVVRRGRQFEVSACSSATMYSYSYLPFFLAW